MAAKICGGRELGWEGAWSTDVAALDGGLQLMLLWADHVLGGLVLPTRIGSFKTYGERGLLDAPVRCVIRGRVVGSMKTVCDIAFMDGTGRMVAELEGAEAHLLPRS